MIEVNFSFGSVFFPALIPLSSVNAFKERGRAVLRNVGVICVLDCFPKKKTDLSVLYILYNRERQDWWYNYL